MIHFCCHFGRCLTTILHLVCHFLSVIFDWWQLFFFPPFLSQLARLWASPHEIACVFFVTSSPAIWGPTALSFFGNCYLLFATSSSHCCDTYHCLAFKLIQLVLCGCFGFSALFHVCFFIYRGHCCCSALCVKLLSQKRLFIIKSNYLAEGCCLVFLSRIYSNFLVFCMTVRFLLQIQGSKSYEKQFSFF